MTINLKRFTERMFEIFFRSSIDLTQAGHALLAMFFGMWLSNPFWETARSTIYVAITQTFEEEVVAAVFAIVGFVEFVSVVLQKRPFRQHMSFAAFLMWLWVTALLWRADWTMPTIPMFIGATVQSAFLYLRQSLSYEQK